MIYGLFLIKLENLVINKIHIAKEYHIAPSEIDRLPFYEYEIYLEQLNIIAKQQEEQNKQQQEDFSAMRSSFNPGKMMNNMTSGMNMPKMPTINIPKI